MKNTLLQEIETIERDASDVVAQERERIAKELETIRNDKEKAKQSLQEKAERTSQAIYQEHVRAAKQDASQIVQESNRIASAIHAASQENTERTLAKVTALFHEEYKTK